MTQNVQRRIKTEQPLPFSNFAFHSYQQNNLNNISNIINMNNLQQLNHSLFLNDQISCNLSNNKFQINGFKLHIHSDNRINNSISINKNKDNNNNNKNKSKSLTKYNNYNTLNIGNQEDIKSQSNQNLHKEQFDNQQQAISYNHINHSKYQNKQIYLGHRQKYKGLRPKSSPIQKSSRISTHNNNKNQNICEEKNRFIPSVSKLYNQNQNQRLKSLSNKNKDTQDKNKNKYRFKSISLLQKINIPIKMFQICSNSYQRKSKISQNQPKNQKRSIKSLDTYTNNLSNQKHLINSPKNYKNSPGVIKDKISRILSNSHRKNLQQIDSPLYLKPSNKTNYRSKQDQKKQLKQLRQTMKNNLKWNLKKPTRCVHVTKLKKDKIIEIFS